MACFVILACRKQDKHYSDGKTKREVTKRIPVLECERNGKHCFEVDPAEDRVD